MMDYTEIVCRISGADVKKCMKCGKCSGACPAYADMEYHPHQFVAMVAKGQTERLMASGAIWKCLSCFACVERCPRDVKPANVIEAVRLMVIRQRGMNHLTSNDIPALLNDQIPQQALMSAMRKYSK